jgi:peptidoglycan/LPS O-acetylase OafA/YrhL
MRVIPLPNLQPVGPDFRPMPRLFWNTFGSIALVAGVVGSQQVDRILGARPLVFLGKISFSMYLIHMPILMSLGLASVKWGRAVGMSYGAAAGTSFVIYIVVVISISTVFFRGVDSPSMRLASYLATTKANHRRYRGQRPSHPGTSGADTKQRDPIAST